VVGLRRRPDLTNVDRTEIREAFNLTYRSGLSPAEALSEMDPQSNWRAPAAQFKVFVRKVIEAQPPFRRGLSPHLSRLDQRRK
jgi:hypothetical protein